MLAALAASSSAGDPLSGLRLGDHPNPDPPPGWVTVRVLSASLNHHDLWTLRGVGVDPGRLPVVLGCDAAGLGPDGAPVVVHAVIATPAPGGSPDETLAPDFSLLSERHDGTLAQWVAVPARNLLPKPEGLSFDEAACLPTCYLTAYRALFVKAGLRPGDRVLIQGAGGGVATAAIVLGRAAGLTVWVTSPTPERAGRAVQIGAHHSFESGARLPDRVHAVLDSVGEATWEHSLKALLPGGTLVSIGATSGPDPPADLRRIFYRQLRVVGSTMGSSGELAALLSFLAATGVRPVIDSVLPLAEAHTGLARLLAGDVFGKIVMRVAEPPPA
ncbi:MAG TPA: zinc-binding dehydrogenase [Actinomycetota bacterium]|nr:zinc-binding dehydrogenase [Actinomycetota bacterium]